MYVTHVLCMLIFLSVTEVTNCYFSCLTWTITENKLHLTCRLQRLVSTVVFIDKNGQEQASCSFVKTVPICLSYNKNGNISLENKLKKDIIYTISGIQEEYLNGKWTCEHGDATYSTVVSTEEGIASSTDLHLIGRINQFNQDTIHLTCFSCREPYGHNVEFMVNHKTEDTIAYNSDTNKCMHSNGECSPDRCSCLPSANEFSVDLLFVKHSSGIQFSCEMNFADRMKSSIFSKIASIFYNGTDFLENATTTIIKKSPSKEENIGRKTDSSYITDLGVGVTDDLVSPIRDLPDTRQGSKNNSNGVSKFIVLIIMTVIAVAIITTVSVCAVKVGKTKKGVCKSQSSTELKNLLGAKESDVEYAAQQHTEVKVEISDNCKETEDENLASIEKTSLVSDNIPFADGVVTEEELAKQPKAIPDPSSTGTKFTVADMSTMTDTFEQSDKKEMVDNFSMTDYNPMYAMIELWTTEDNKVVVTNALTILKGLSRSHDVLTVIGSFGCGKSTALRHVALYLHRCFDYRIIPISSPESIKTYFNSAFKQVFVFDDVFGKYSVDKQVLDLWQSKAIELKQLIKSKESNQIKIILSCRENIFNQVRGVEIPLISASVFDLSSLDNRLSINERTQIAEKYLTINQAQTVKQLNILSRFDFFPLLCSRYSQKSSNDISEFFNEQIFNEHLTYLMNSDDQSTFTTLLLFVLFNNSISVNLLWNSSHMVWVVSKLFPSKLSMDSVETKIKDLLTSYVKMCTRNYAILNSKLFDILVSFYGKHKFETVLEFSESSVLRDCFQFETVDKYTDYLVSVSAANEKAYFRRLVKDLEEDLIIDVFENRQMQFPLYRTKLIRFLNESKCIIEHLLAFPMKKYSLMSLMAGNGYNDIVQLFLDNGYQTVLEDSNECTPLLCAARKGHANTVEILLKWDSNPNIRNKKNYTPLHVAAKYGFKDIIQLLLDYKADINPTNNLNRTPLWIASSMGNVEIVLHLLKHNADPNIHDDMNQTPLMEACRNDHIDVVSVLLDCKVDCNCMNIYHETALFIASDKGSFEIVKLLLEKNCHPDIPNADNETCLWISSFLGNTDIVEELLQRRADPNILNTKNESPLSIAASMDYPRIVNILINYHADINIAHANRGSPLWIASSKGNAEVVKILLEHDCEHFSMFNNIRFSPLHIATLNKKTNVVQILLKKKCDPNITDEYFKTPLHVACDMCVIEIVELLLEHKSNPNAVSKKHETPLHIATRNGFYEIVQLLLRYNAICDVTDVKNETPLYIATKEGNNRIVTLLLAHKCDINIKNVIHQSPLYIATKNNYIEIVKVLLQSNCDPNVHDDKNPTPLYLASKKGFVNIVEELLLHDSDPNICYKSQKSPLYIASSKNYIKIVNLLIQHGAFLDTNNLSYVPLLVATRKSNIDIVKLLLKQGCNPNHLDQNNETALHIASRCDHRKIVKLLLDYNCYPNSTNNENQTAIQIAKLKQYNGIVALLQKTDS